MADWIYHKKHDAKVVASHEVADYYKKGWTDEPGRPAMTDFEIENAKQSAQADRKPCITCGHIKPLPGAPVEEEPAEITEEAIEEIIDDVDGEPVEDGEEPVNEGPEPYEEMTNAELIKAIEAEGIKANKSARKEELIAALKLVKGE